MPVPASEVGASHFEAAFQEASEHLFERGVYGQPGAARSRELCERLKNRLKMGSPGAAGAAAT